MSLSSSPASAASGSAPPPHVVEDCLGIVQLLSDGTVTRTSDYSRVPPPANARDDLPVRWKDVVYDDALGLRLRMYRPTAGGEKLPVIVYFHSGGFCIGSFELPMFHAVGLRLANDLPAVVLSANYRLAPEHRLPAAHDDAVAVFSWLRNQAISAAKVAADADPWLAESADFERVFVAGASAGGNISHHIAVRHGSGGLDLEPARLAGCIMLFPYFAGEERTASEATCPAGVFMNLAWSEQLWRLALPARATKDHPSANPFGPESAPLGAVALPPMLVADGDQDMLHDRIVDYAARLKAMGKPLELVVFKGQHHEFFAFEPWGKASDELVRVMKRFIYGGELAISPTE